MKNKLKGFEKEIIESYESGVSGVELSKKYVVEPSSIYRLLRRNKTSVKKISEAKRKYTIDENYFEEIDSEGKAYFLGFLFADGYNNTDKNHVYLTLHKQDIEILKTFSIEIDSNKPLRDDRGYVRFVIENKKMSADLHKLGCVKNKHNCIELPTNINNDLMRHFIRGFFDGDGSICKSQTACQMNVTSNRIFLESLQIYLMNVLNLNKTKIFDRYDKIDSPCTMYYGGKNQLKKFYNYFYENSCFYLKRKKEKFESILNIKKGD